MYLAADSGHTAWSTTLASPHRDQHRRHQDPGPSCLGPWRAVVISETQPKRERWNVRLVGEMCVQKNCGESLSVTSMQVPRVGRRTHCRHQHLLGTCLCTWEPSRRQVRPSARVNKLIPSASCNGQTKWRFETIPCTWRGIGGHTTPSEGMPTTRHRELPLLSTLSLIATLVLDMELGSTHTWPPHLSLLPWAKPSTSP